MGRKKSTEEHPQLKKGKRGGHKPKGANQALDRSLCGGLRIGIRGKGEDIAIRPKKKQ